ncbi:hypothetical protein GIX45_23105 [Erwinia sp. CPCC 100877]|nr:hypothetical protein [Erwinia sp. CPCC 100877]
MIEKIMLEDTAKRKLTLFKLLNKYAAEAHSIKFYENKTDYSYSRVVYLLELIEQDLSEMLGKDAQLLQAHGVCYQASISYDRYYQYLITQSIPYQILISILYYPADDLEKFCEKNYHSRATVVRKSKLLNDYFKQFQIKWNISQLTLSGNERVIRMTIYALIWSTSYGAKLPVIKKNSIEYDRFFKEIESYFPDSYSYAVNRQLTLMLDIIYLRVTAGYGLTKKEEIEPYIPDYINYMGNFLEQTVQDKERLAAECQFATFLLISTPNYFRTDDYRLSLLRIYLQKENNAATKIFKEFCAFFSEEIMGPEFSWEKEQILWGNAANLIFSRILIKEPYPGLFHLINHSPYVKSDYYHQLFVQFKKLFQKIAKRKNYSWLKALIVPLADMLASLLFPAYESYQGNHLIRVALISESNYLLVQPLAKFIEELAFVQLVPYKHDDFSSFDFMVSTSSFLLPEENPLPSFIFRLSADNDEQYIGLYQALRNAHNKKISNRG